MTSKKGPLLVLIFLCLTLGLAPFSPEPHVWGKLKWIVGGAKEMTLLDYVDLLLHASPWLLLIVYLFRKR